MPGWDGYRQGRAPVMCLEGGGTNGSHGLRHSYHKTMSDIEANGFVSFNKELAFCAEGAAFIAPQCTKECLEKQLKDGHEGMGDKRKKIRHSPSGREPTDAEMKSMEAFQDNARF